MSIHDARLRLRAALRSGQRVSGTFIKLATLDVIELAASAGFDFVVVDLEHSTLSEAEAIALVRHAELTGLPALVRVARVEATLINRLLENGAAGIQLSMLRGIEQASALRQVTRYAPSGRRSVSLANRAAAFGQGGLVGYLQREAEAPPLLIGQLETAETDPLTPLLAGLDGCFVGTTDLAVDLGQPGGGPALTRAVAAIEDGARAAGVAFGGWVPSAGSATELGLGGASYLIVGSDLQILAAGLRAAVPMKGGC